MKILTAEQIRLADQFTIENEPISSIDLMERASGAFTDWFIRKFTTAQSVIVVSGTGNNGGDGLAIARIIKNSGFDVTVMIIGSWEKGSPDFKINLNRLKDLNRGTELLSQKATISQDVVIDALFGSGLTRPVTGNFADIINRINGSESTVVSVDIPSGLFCDKPVLNGAIVEADYVVSFQVPKLSFFLPQHGGYVGNWEVVDIGFKQEYIDSVESSNETVDPKFISSLFKVRAKFYHKGNAGRALLVTGRRGKIGASILCAKACLRSGIGLLELHIPGDGNIILQTTVPEAMVHLDSNPNYITQTTETEAYDVIGFGPGIGQDKATIKAIGDYIEKCKTPVVIDADALNILSSNPLLIPIIPANSILTPHPGEFKRMVGDWTDDYDRLEKQKEFSSKHNVIVVLKNAHTSTTLPDGRVFFNTTGNPGMATAGSGDVLTGIITGLLGQGYEPWKSAILAVYLHGLAGDISKEILGVEESIIASDIVDNLPKAISQANVIIIN